MDNEGQVGQPIEVLDDKEDEDIASSIVDGDAVEATQLQEQKEAEKDNSEDIMKYTSVWRAVVNGKENLASQSAIYADEELYMHMIRRWQDEVIRKA